MENLKEIKDVLVKIPDIDLEGLRFGLGEGAETDISLIAEETGSLGENHIGYPEIFEKHPDINKIGKMIQNIVKCQKIIDEDTRKAEDLSEILNECGVSDKITEEHKELF